MTIFEKIQKIAFKMDKEDCELVLFMLEETSQEFRCRTTAMGFTLKLLNTLFGKGVTLETTAAQLVFITCYPLSVLLCSQQWILKICCLADCLQAFAYQEKR